MTEAITTSGPNTSRPVLRMGVVVACILLLAVIAGCLWTHGWLMRSGEYLDLDKIVEQQQKSRDILFAAKLADRTFYYKQEIYRQRKPDIVALGSSRLLSLRQEHFSQPFANLSGMTTLAETAEIANSLFEQSPPKHVILGIDPWWFHPLENKRHISRSGPVRIFLITDLLHALASGRITSSAHIGLQARQTGNGYAFDGSYLPQGLFTGVNVPQEAGFDAALRQKENATGPFLQGSDISEAQWVRLQELILFLKEKDIAVTILLPPVAPDLTSAFLVDELAYIQKLRWMLQEMTAERNTAFFDYTDGNVTGLSNCEFIDALHPGEIALQRVLLDMAIANSNIRDIVKLADIGYNIATYAGQASTLEGEWDYLRMGCKKKTKQEKRIPDENR